jgi:hypothetical protein
MRLTWKRTVLAAVITAALMVGAAVWLLPFIAQDRCLDSGGAWKKDQCVR